MGRFDKIKQFVSEKAKLANPTGSSDDFVNLEAELALRRRGTDRLHASINAYTTQLSKKKQISSSGDVEPLSIHARLKKTFAEHAEDFAESQDDAGAASPENLSSAYAQSLVLLSKAHGELDRFTQEFCDHVGVGIMTGLERVQRDFEDWDRLRKKLESRRLGLDAALAKSKSGTQKDKANEKEKRDNKKGKDRNNEKLKDVAYEVEEEIRIVRDKYEDTAAELHNTATRIRTAELDQLRDLGGYLDVQIDFAKRCFDALHECKRQWVDESTLSHVEPPSQSQTTAHAFILAPSPPKESPSSISIGGIKDKLQTPPRSRSNSKVLGSSQLDLEAVSPVLQKESSVKSVASAKTLRASGAKRTSFSAPSGPENESPGEESSNNGDGKDKESTASRFLGSVMKKIPTTPSLLSRSSSAGGGPHKEYTSITSPLPDGAATYPPSGADSSPLSSLASSLNIPHPSESPIRFSRGHPSTSSMGGLDIAHLRRRSSAPSGRIQQRTMVEAKWDYVASEPDELNLNIGDRVLVQDKVNEEWWIGTKAVGSEHSLQQRGIFPAAYAFVVHSPTTAWFGELDPTEPSVEKPPRKSSGYHFLPSSTERDTLQDAFQASLKDEKDISPDFPGSSDSLGDYWESFSAPGSDSDEGEASKILRQGSSTASSPFDAPGTVPHLARDDARNPPRRSRELSAGPAAKIAGAALSNITNYRNSRAPPPPPPQRPQRKRTSTIGRTNNPYAAAMETHDQSPFADGS